MLLPLPLLIMMLMMMRGGKRMKRKRFLWHRKRW